VLKELIRESQTLKTPMTDQKKRRATENKPKSDKKSEKRQKKTHEKIFLLFHAPYILGL